uniref:Uncharacterized protein n=1 Tax=Anguilla anguilla TaxID=7936 RepID=A0A0E9TS91_ANGAN
MAFGTMLLYSAYALSEPWNCFADLPLIVR